LDAKNVKKIGVIGCGTIGTLIAKAVEKKIIPCDELIVYDYKLENAERLRSKISFPVKITRSLDELLESKPTVIVEAASQQAAREYVPKILQKDIELVVMSVGALLDLHVKSKKIHVPSGAIGGLDAISSAALAGIDEVVLTTRKNPATLDMDNREERLVFEGNAEQAVKRFPREMNVAATLALTVGSEKVRVKVVSDPEVTKNVHEVEVKWKHGDMLLKFINDPHPDNPKTSALAAWSAMKLLKDLLEKSD
jgi:aspartate dehydrogenase